MSLSGVRVTVPASTANLGSGFDAFGLALGIHDMVEVHTAPADTVVRVIGEGAGQVPTDDGHLVVRALRATAGELGLAIAGLRLRCVNGIPHARGLGSSAAAVVAGVAAGYALAGTELDGRALQIAASFEGHADNAAASLYGGLVVVWSAGGEFRHTRVPVRPIPRPVLLVPATRSATNQTRGLLPDLVPHADAAFAAGRAALAVHAFAGHPELLLAALEDRLHEPYRQPAWPRTVRLVDELREAGVPAAVSGAGPSVIAFPAATLPQVDAMTGFTPLAVDIDQTGVVTEPLPGPCGPVSG